MKKVKTLKNETGSQVAVVMRDKENDEFVVQLFLNGEHLTEADYFTNDRDDAIGTAKNELAREWKRPEVDRSVSLTVSDELAGDVLANACEGGSDYWAEFTALANVQGEHGPEWGGVLVADQEAEETRTASRLTIIKGIQAIVNNPDTCREDIRETVLSAVLHDDACYIDGEAADVILQVGLFGEVVYG